MIFVTVGMAYGFNRLVKKMDEISRDINEEIIIQIGDSTFEPKNAKYFRFGSKEQVNKLYSDARIIVCHSGVGSIITSLEYGKSTIVVPRLKIYGEHIDNHQIEIAKEFEKRGAVTVIYNIEDLNKTIDTIKSSSFIISKNCELIKNLKTYLNTL